jgi:hypothetical protein
LLPGLRELRAPLVAGYVHLLSLFILFWGAIPTKSEAEGSLSQIYDLADWLGKPIMLAVATFGAYLLGSLLRIPALTTVAYLGVMSRETINQYVEERLGLQHGEWEGDRLHRLQKAGTMYLGLHQVRTRLYLEAPDLYGDYDRLVAEADLKLNVTVAGIVLSSLMAFKVNPWWAFLLAPMALLYYRGVKTLWEANDILVQAIVADTVKSSSLEKYISDLSELK